MYYRKIKRGTAIIEFYNNWLGKETIIVNGQVVSEKSSIMGTDHYFSITENGAAVEYQLTTKVTEGIKVLIDLRKEGKLVEGNIEVKSGGKPDSLNNQFKKSGIAKVKRYDIDEGIADLQKELETNPNDPEIYFYLACGYSIKEMKAEGLSALKQALVYNLQNREEALQHDLLAYLRMQSEFEQFKISPP